MVDFHSHVLPAVDDGSANITESLAMLHLLSQQGVTHVVATPHFYPAHDDPARFLECRARAEDALREKIAKHGALPAITVGAEVYYFRGMSESEFLPQLTIGEKPYILIEMPPAPWQDDLCRELELIAQKQGITPIIAHIDRYISPLHTHGIPARLAQLPVLVQANADFFLNWKTAAMAVGMLKAGQIHLLGSDCHNMRSRKPNFGPAAERIAARLGENTLHTIHRNACQILGLPDPILQNGVRL